MGFGQEGQESVRSVRSAKSASSVSSTSLLSSTLGDWLCSELSGGEKKRIVSHLFCIFFIIIVITINY